MGWHINLDENTLSLTKAQFKGLAEILCGEFGMDVDETLEIISETAPLLGFDYDAMEHMDYLHDPDVQSYLCTQKVKGIVCFSSNDGDNKGTYWSYTFDGAGNCTTDGGRIRDLHKKAKTAVATASVTGQPLAGKNMVITGKLNRGTRAEWTAKLEAFGAHVQSNVSEDTHLLITNGDIATLTTEKAVKAKKLNIPVMDEVNTEAMLQLLS